MKLVVCNLGYMAEVNNKTRSKIDLSLVKEVANNFLKYYKKENFEVSIAFVGDRKIRELNKAYRKKDRATDVLAFPGEGEFLGEIIINYAQIKRQAKRFNHSVDKELGFILVHGLLHLLGYDDETDKSRKEMEKLGRGFIKTLSIKS